jgi:hypothetical protein
MSILTGDIQGGIFYKFIPQDQSSESVQGTLQVSRDIKMIEEHVPEFAQIRPLDEPSSQFELTLTASKTSQKNVHIAIREERSSIPLLSLHPYLAVDAAQRDDPATAAEYVREQYAQSSPNKFAWEFRDDCRDAVSFDSYVDVMNTLSGVFDSIDTVTLRSALGYFAKRIGEESIHGIHSISTLRDRINQWNSKSNLPEVDFDEVIVEKLSRRWYREEFGSERDELRSIGFDPVGIDATWDTLIPAGWLAHLVHTDGIPAAKKYAKERSTPTNRSYDELKNNAWDASYNDRGRAWGPVVGLSAQPQNDDFCFDAYNYLKWTAEGYRGKSKLAAMIFAAAETVVPSHMASYHRQQMAFKSQISIGHAWRRDRASERERAAFKRALLIARGEDTTEYEYKPERVIDALSSLAHARAKDANSPREQRQELQAAIRRIEYLKRQHGVDNKTVEKETDFLSSQIEEFS